MIWQVQSTWNGNLSPHFLVLFFCFFSILVPSHSQPTFSYLSHDVYAAFWILIAITPSLLPCSKPAYVRSRPYRLANSGHLVSLPIASQGVRSWKANSFNQPATSRLHILFSTTWPRQKWKQTIARMTIKSPLKPVSNQHLSASTGPLCNRVSATIIKSRTGLTSNEHCHPVQQLRLLVRRNASDQPYRIQPTLLSFP